MNDGASSGAGASRAPGTILAGAPQPADDERDSPGDVRDRILAAARRGGAPRDNGDCADMAAGMVLMFYGAHPEAREWPGEPAYHWERDGELADPAVSGWENVEHVKDGPDLHRQVDAFTEGKLKALGMSGFRWGEAVNAARYSESLPPQPNPAIITVGAFDSEDVSA